ncbi:MAG: proteasome assembly chaperone family protein [Candidatus Altiarchaeota archaeon]|nr:proteasome assembly chaperone family protein [Candidatus Altiarchaeota archaeon]
MIETCGRMAGKTLVLGFHGIGMVGFIAVDFLTRKLGAKKIGWMFRKEMPEIAYVDKGLVGMPIELFSYKNLIFLKVNVTMEREVMNLVTSEIISWAKKKRISKTIVIGGLAGKKKGTVYGVSNSYGNKLRQEMGLAEFKQDLRVFGPMAASLIYGEKSKMPVVCMLPVSRFDRPDPEAASKAIQVLNKLCKFEVDTKALKQEARKIEKKISEMGEKKDDSADRMFR